MFSFYRFNSPDVTIEPKFRLWLSSKSDPVLSQFLSFKEFKGKGNV